MKVITGGSLVPKKHILKKNQKGQATIEFLLVFAFALGVTFLFLNLAINSTQGYIVHYANFMASRTFMSYDGGSNNLQNSISGAANASRRVFQRYPLEAFDIKAQFNVLKPTLGASNALYSGTTSVFEKRITPFKLVGGGAKVIMFSESFLSKDPVRFACWKGTCSGIGQNSCDFGLDTTLFDNGC